jgi:hypothetical protein
LDLDLAVWEERPRPESGHIMPQEIDLSIDKTIDRGVAVADIGA